MLTNPGFEDGVFGAKNVPDNWTMSWSSYTSAWTWVETGGVGGGKHIKMQSYLTTGGSAFMYQTVLGVTPDTEYAFSVWAKSPTPGETVEAWGNYDWFDSASSIISGDWLYPDNYYAGDTWTKVALTLYGGGNVIAPEGSVGVWFYLCGYDGNAAAGGVLYDDAKILGPDPNAPDVDAGDNMVTLSGLKVELDPNVVNNSNPVTALTYLWTANPDDGVVFDPPSADVENPNITITKPALVSTAVAIANPGFETPVLADGDYTGDFTNCPGWSDVDEQTEGGVWNPGLSGYTGYGGNAPNGQNIAYVNNSGIEQVLTKTLTADTTYTLTVKVGNTDGFDWTGYKVQLLAGETLLAEDDNTVAIAEDTFETSTVAYTYDSGDAALLGQPLQIQLLCLGENGEADFDDVQLTAVGPAPDPYIVTLTLTVNNVAAPPDRARDDTMTIDVYDDACLATIAVGLAEFDPADVDENCITNFEDFALMATAWLVDYTLTGSAVKP